jgi:hypothetical protein
VPDFQQRWIAVQRIPLGTRIPVWSLATGEGKSFEVLVIGSAAVQIRLETGSTRLIQKSAFERVYGGWKTYLAGGYRQDLRELSSHSTYVISIFHHIGM